MRQQVPRAQRTLHTDAPLGVFHVRREAERKEPLDLHAAQVGRHRARARVLDDRWCHRLLASAASPESDLTK